MPFTRGLDLQELRSAWVDLGGEARHAYQSFALGASLLFVLDEVAPAAAEAKLDMSGLDISTCEVSRVEGRVTVSL